MDPFALLMILVVLGIVAAAVFRPGRRHTTPSNPRGQGAGTPEQDAGAIPGAPGDDRPAGPGAEAEGVSDAGAAAPGPPQAQSRPPQGPAQGATPAGERTDDRFGRPDAASPSEMEGRGNA